MAGTTQVLRALPWNMGMAQYMTSSGPNPDPAAITLAWLAMRPWLTRTALGAPVEPEVNRSRYSTSGPGSSDGTSPSSVAAGRSGEYAGASQSRTRPGSTPVSRPSSSGSCAASVTMSWHAVCLMSRASSCPRRVGLIPTTVAPARAAPPRRKRYSGTFSRSTPTWNGPSRRSAVSMRARAADSATTWRQLHDSSSKRRPVWSSPARATRSSATVVIAPTIV